MTGARAAGSALLAAVVALCLAQTASQPGCPMPLGSFDSAASCLSPSAWPRMDIVASGLAATLAIAVVTVGSILRQAVAHQRLSSALAELARPAMLADQSVNLVPELAGPTVAGLRRPTIYCSEDLTRRLDADEVRAALLHERHHQLAFAPARLVVLSGLAPIVGRVGVGRMWLERQRARLEIAADEYALRSGARRSAIARALVKLGPAAPLGSLAGFATAHELRLRALLREPLRVAPERTTSLPAASLAVVAVAVAVACLVLPVG